MSALALGCAALSLCFLATWPLIDQLFLADPRFTDMLLPVSLRAGLLFIGSCYLAPVLPGVPGRENDV